MREAQLGRNPRQVPLLPVDFLQPRAAQQEGEDFSVHQSLAMCLPRGPLRLLHNFFQNDGHVVANPFLLLRWLKANHTKKWIMFDFFGCMSFEGF